MSFDQLITRDQAKEIAKSFLREQPNYHDFDENSARVIESNECINILFRYKQPRKPPEILISIEKKGGKAEAVKLG